MKRFIIGFYLTLSLAAQAQTMGQGGGNGGDVVVCKNEQGTLISSEILDVYEAKEMRQIFLSLGATTLSLEEKMGLLTKRLSSISPTLAKYVASEYKNFWEQASFLDNIILNDIPDSDHLYVPKGCEIKQIAIQRKPEFEEDKLYVISNDLWKTLDNDNKIALIIHEVLYKIAIQNGHQDSRKVRYLNSIFLSEKITAYSGVKFPALIKKIAIHNDYFTYLYKGYEFKASDYNPDSMWIGGELLVPQNVEISGNILLVEEINFFKEQFGSGISRLVLSTMRSQKFYLEDELGEVIVDANICSVMLFNTYGALESVFGCDINGRLKSYAMVNGQKLEFIGHLEFSHTPFLVRQIFTNTPYLHEYLGNQIPLYGILLFSSGTLSPSTYYISETKLFNIADVTFNVEKNDKVVIDYFGRLTFAEFAGYSSFIKLKHQKNRFQCFEPISFHLNSSLNSCMIVSKGDGIELNKLDGSIVRVHGGNMVYFDEQGYLIKAQ